MKINFKEIMGFILFWLIFGSFLLYITIQVCPIIWHDFSNYFNSVDRMYRFFRLIVLLCVNGIIFYIFGFVKGTEKGSKIKQKNKIFR